MLAFPRAIPSGPDGPVSDLAGTLEAGLRRAFADRPVAIAWGMKVPAFTPQWLELWLLTFPQAQVLRLPMPATTSRKTPTSASSPSYYSSSAPATHQPQRGKSVQAGRRG
jgi:hypothetical protein